MWLSVCLQNVWDTHCVDYLVVGLVDFNRHMGRHIDGFECVHGGYGVDQGTLE